MQVKTISSSGTFAIKFIIPCILVIYFIFSMIEMLTPASPNFGWIHLIMSLVALLFTRDYFGLKRVRYDANNLYISNYFREISVPLNSIKSVGDNLGYVFGYAVIVNFKQTTSFGSKIKFRPKISAAMVLEFPVYSNFLDVFVYQQFEHPIIGELQELSGLRG